MTTQAQVRPRAKGDDQRASSSKPDDEKTRITGYVYVVGAVAALGGLLFGFDTGVISGAQTFLTASFHLNSTTQEIAVSAVLVGTIIGAAIGGRLSDWLGRRLTLMVMAVVFAIGAILTAISPNLAFFIAMRVIVGVGIGSASVAAPLYASELAPPSVRGKLVFLFQFAVTFGILVAYIVDLVFANAGLGWGPMFGVAIVPAAILGGAMVFLKDTPRWLASKDRWDEARAVMEDVDPLHVDREMDRIREALDAQSRSSARELFKPGLRTALIVAVGLAVLQQLVGINTIIYYAPIVTGYSGFAVSSAAGGSLLGAVIVGVVNVISTIVAIFLVDRIGRRPLLLFGTVGCLLTLTATGILFLFDPKQVGIVLLIAILLYIVSFAIGLGPTYWLLADEVFPTRLRGAGSSISTVGNWTANLLVSITFLSLVGMVGRSFTFWIYAFFALVEVVFVWRLVPETKNKPLEAIEDYWENDQSWEKAEHAADSVAS